MRRWWELLDSGPWEAVGGHNLVVELVKGMTNRLGIKFVHGQGS